MRSPILFLVFNRPDTTARVFEAIKAAQPPRLYVAADGPRPGRDGEAALCAETRRLATAVDWPCEVKTQFQEQNLGCRLGPVSGLDWIFAHEEEGIILEDAVLPVETFFPYCDELLERYRDDERVGVIGGNNRVSWRFTPEESYFFSRYLHVWGWASWRRVWRLYDMQMAGWPRWLEDGGLERVSPGGRWFAPHWRRIFDWGFYSDVDWWSYQLLLALWRAGMLVIMPSRNQIHNIGFGPDSTHTQGRMPRYMVKSLPGPLPFPLRHPSAVAADPAVDRMIGREVYGISVRGRIRDRLNSVKVWARHLPWLGDRLKAAQIRLSGGRRR